MPPPFRGFPIMVWTGSQVVVYGSGSSAGIYNDLWWYDPATDAWTDMILQEATGSPPGRFESGLGWGLAGPRASERTRATSRAS
jgi:hypothetical protein